MEREEKLKLFKTLAELIDSPIDPATICDDIDCSECPFTDFNTCPTKMYRVQSIEEAQEAAITILQKIGGEGAAELYKRKILSFERLRTVLGQGYTIKQIEKMYENYLKVSNPKDSFEEVVFKSIHLADTK